MKQTFKISQKKKEKKRHVSVIRDVKSHPHVSYSQWNIYPDLPVGAEM